MVQSSLQRIVAFSCLLIINKQGSCRNLPMFYLLLAYKLLVTRNHPDLSCLSSPKDLPQSQLRGKLHQNKRINYILLFCCLHRLIFCCECMHFYTYFDSKIMRPYVTSSLVLAGNGFFPCGLEAFSEDPKERVHLLETINVCRIGGFPSLGCFAVLV